MDPQAPAPSSILAQPAAAQCAIHPGQSFTSVCSRCGSYMCAQCTEQGRFETCAACRARTGTGALTLHRGNWTLDAVMRHANVAYRQNIGQMTIGVVILLGIVTLFNGVGSAAQALLSDPMLIVAVNLVMIIPQTMVQGVLTLGLLSMALSAARGEPVELTQLFGYGKRLGGWLLQTLLVYVPIIPIAAVGFLIVWLFKFQLSNTTMWLALGLLVLVSTPPLLYFFFGMAFANTELVAQPQVSALGAMRNSFRIAHGQRWMLFVCGALVGVMCFLGVLACFIGLLFALGYASVMFATLYLTLRNGTEGLEGGA